MLGLLSRVDVLTNDEDHGASGEVDATKYINLFSGIFRRVVYDEGHKIKNLRTRNHFTI